MSPFNETNARPVIETLEGRQLMAAQVLYTETFENGMNGWSEDRITDQRQAWGITAGFAHSGSKSASTMFAGRDAVLHSPKINLPKVDQYNEHLYFRFWQFTDYASKGGYGTSAPVVRAWDTENNMWSGWLPVEINMQTAPQRTTTWGYCGLDLTLWGGASVQIGFSHVGGTNGARGWAVDDVTITKEPIQRRWTADTSFENGWNGWWATNGLWNVGQANGIGAATGTKMAGTGLNANAGSLESSALVSPAFYLPADPGRTINLQFKSYMDQPFVSLCGVELQKWAPSYGWMSVDYLSTTGIDTNINGGQPAGRWQTFTLGAGFTGSTALPYRILFNMNNGMGNNRGWFIDDVKLNYPGKVAQNPTPNPTPTVKKPEIAVSNQFGNITDGVTSVFWGTHARNSGSKDLTFTIRNTGSATLNVGTITLLRNSGFAIVQQPAKTVAAGGFTTFKIRLLTTVAGTKSATLQFLTNDSDEGTFNFNIGGVVR